MSLSVVLLTDVVNADQRIVLWK